MTIRIPPDVIDVLLGTRPDDTLDTLRSLRPATREHTQRSFEALFQPVDESHIGLAERYAIAVFVAALHKDVRLTEFYAAGLGDHPALLSAVRSAADAGQAEGPYGSYREAGLQAENQEGLTFQVGTAGRDALGTRLAAALDHAHRLVFHPRDSRPEALEALIAAGWDTDGIVTLSQLIAFLTFQIRVVSGLLTLAETLPLTHPTEASS
ncbi:CMD domain protein [Klugiella xanthotipulae]|uniref:CMD domain protein n=1 Tax=Klugiella xanthotipulae TaxID=244735 RepID=A0A543I5Q5_9MICO|nr:CMD domain protein [Klugiella xanthotipulae]TQM65871.1 CMD domain protein [Klugiella xanthotipulae]